MKRTTPCHLPRRFLAITSALRLRASTPPTFCDKFWEFRDLIASWNALMKDVFSAARAVCLDESMSIWHSQWTCPGWVFCPRKPHPFGNKHHTACCELSGAMFSMEMVEGKDHPPQIKERFSELGKTTGLLMRMLECYFATGRYVILDSGFCVLKALVELKGRIVCMRRDQEATVLASEGSWRRHDGCFRRGAGRRLEGYLWRA